MKAALVAAAAAAETKLFQLGGRAGCKTFVRRLVRFQRCGEKST